VVWALYNENWGLLESALPPSTIPWARTLVRHTREIGGNRLVVDNSGGWHFDTDLVRLPQYLPTVEKTRELYSVYTARGAREKWPAPQRVSVLLAAAESLPPPMVRPSAIRASRSCQRYGGFGFYSAENKPLLENFRDYTLAVGEFPSIVGYCYTSALTTWSRSRTA